MIVREGQKKLTNVCIITLRKDKRTFELAVYPNKLFEYRNDPSVPLEEILHTNTIYKNISTGEVASEKDLEVFGRSSDSGRNSASDCIIREILDQGREQKAHETSKHELESIEKQIVDMVQTKVTYNGMYVSKDILEGFIKQVWSVKNQSTKKQAGGVKSQNVKKQVSSIIPRLVELGFERIWYRVRCEKAGIQMEGVTETDGHYLVRSDVLPSFTDECEKMKVSYVVLPQEEQIEEEIC